jgi:hypothetical protein
LCDGCRVAALGMYHGRSLMVAWYSLYMKLKPPLSNIQVKNA